MSIQWAFSSLYFELIHVCVFHLLISSLHNRLLNTWYVPIIGAVTVRSAKYQIYQYQI